MPQGEVTAAEQGIYVGLNFAPERPIRKFLKDMPHRIAEPFDEPDIHASIMYAEELAEAGIGQAERTKIPEALKRISEGIRELDIIGREIAVVPNMLRPFKRFVCVTLIDDDEILDSVRFLSAETVTDVMGVSLGNQLREYHAAVARRHRASGSHKSIPYAKNFPKKFTIAGFNVGEHAILRTNGANQQYKNTGMFANPAQRHS